MAKPTTKSVVMIGASVAMLLGAAADRISVSAPADATPYHAQVKATAGVLPMRIGDWVGRDVPQPKEAVQLLRPNVIVSRQYESMVAGSDQIVSLLLVQCPDARDLVGHYPPICYPNQGWRLVSQSNQEWVVSGTRVPVIEYEFLRPTGGVPRLIRNFFVLPNGTFARDMAPVDALSKNVERRFYGAAQVQIIMDESIPRDERNQVFETLVAGNWPVIESIRAGAGK